MSDVDMDFNRDQDVHDKPVPAGFYEVVAGVQFHTQGPDDPALPRLPDCPSPTASSPKISRPEWKRVQPFPIR